MKEMVYRSKDNPEELLDSGIIDDYPYFITNYNSHPCAYIGLLLDNPLSGISDTDLLRIDCHGGVSFAGYSHNEILPKSIWLIGWDYSQSGDYYYEDGGKSRPGKQWTTKEIKEEVRTSIWRLDDLVNLAKQIKFNTEIKLLNLNKGEK